MTRIACVSDLHGRFPHIPDCDLILLGGDYCPLPGSQLNWFYSRFNKWLRMISEQAPVIGIAGNHDILFEQASEYARDMDWTYLQDSGCQHLGLKFWGTPWQPPFNNWAFNLPEEQLEQKWDLIPNDTDVLIVHGPPHKCLDFSYYGNCHTGSPSLRRKIEQIQPKLVVTGHIHESYGKAMIGNSIVLNCALVQNRSEAMNPIQIVEL